MHITVPKPYRAIFVIGFLLFWALFFFGGLMCVVFWFPKLLVFCWNTLMHGLSTIPHGGWLHYLMVPFNIFTWFLAVVFFIWTGVYRFSVMKSVTKSTKRNISVRFA